MRNGAVSVRSSYPEKTPQTSSTISFLLGFQFLCRMFIWEKFYGYNKKNFTIVNMSFIAVIFSGTGISKYLFLVQQVLTFTPPHFFGKLHTPKKRGDMGEMIGGMPLGKKMGWRKSEYLSGTISGC